MIAIESHQLAAQMGWSDAALIPTDHREFDHALAVEEAPWVVDIRNATRGLAASNGRIVRL